MTIKQLNKLFWAKIWTLYGLYTIDGFTMSNTDTFIKLIANE